MSALGTTDFPIQSIPLREKDEAWKKRTVDAIIGRSDFRYAGHLMSFSDQIPLSDSLVSSRSLAAKVYEMYNGIINSDDYTHVTDPYNSEEAVRRYPAKLKNYNVIKPFVDLLLGEFIKRPIAYTVNVENEDVITQRDEQVKNAVIENLYAQFLKQLKSMGQDVPEDETPENLPSPEEVFQLARSSYRDARAISGQAAVNYVFSQQDVRDKFVKGFFHWLLSGEVISSTRVVNDDVIYSIENPLDVDYDKSPDTDFIQDGDWAILRKMLHVSGIIDEFRHLLSDEQIKRLEQGARNQGTSSAPYTSVQSLANNGLVDTQAKGERLIEVFYCYWKSRKRVAFIKDSDPLTGVEFEMVMDEEEFEAYKKQGLQIDSVEWQWTNEVWQGIRIDEDIYLDIKPTPVQRNGLNNESLCKLPINGRRYSDINAPNVSFAMQLIPYQLTYNIYRYRLENLIAKSKDMIAMIDINLKPEDWSIEKWLYFADATGLMFVNYAKEGLVLNPQHQTLLDLTAKSIQQYIALLEFTLNEIGELTGITRQRKGDVAQFDLKGVVEQSIIQSSHITEYLFDRFNTFIESSLEGILDYSKIAFIHNKAGSYVMPDGSQEFFSIDGLQFAETDYGITVTVNSKQVQQLNEAKQLAQAFVQNGAPMGSVLDMLRADNFSELRNRIEQAEEMRRQQEQALEEAKIKVLEEANQLKQAEIDAKLQGDQIAAESRIQVALINAQSRQLGEDQDDNDNGIIDANEQMLQRIEDDRRIVLDRQKLVQKDKQEVRVLAQDWQKHLDKMQLEGKKLRQQKAQAAKSPAKKS